MSEPANPQPLPETHPFARFTEAMKKLVTVPKAEILRREAEYREQRKAEKAKGAK
jgi:hypothetical protein